MPVALLSEADVRDPRESSPHSATEELLTDPPWFGQVFERLVALFALSPGWDSYGAVAPRPDAIEAAFDLLLQLSSPAMPEPQVVPLASGGVQLEWHQPAIELEIEVHSPFRFDVFYENRETGDTREEELMADLSPLRSWVDQLSG